MRVPKINSKDIGQVREETVEISGYVRASMADNSWQEDERSLDRMIKRIERLVRGSIEYKEYVSFLKDEIDMNSCSFFSGVSRKEDQGVRIEIHHAPLTLYDITSILFNFMQIHEVDPTPFDVADAVMRCHFEGLVGLAPLSVTAHELVHTGDAFVPVDKVYGNVREFYDRFRDGFTQDHKNLLRENVEATRQLNGGDGEYAPAILERKYTYLKVEGVDLLKKISDGSEDSATA